jgi:hypothetical protein
VDVTNRGAERVTEVALRLHLNREVERVEARGTTLFQSLPLVRSPGPPAPGDGAPGEWVDLLLPELAARSDRAWVVDYREAGSLRNTATARSKP